MNQPVKLTQFAKSAGCGCKIAPAVLNEILENNRILKDANLLNGNKNNEDAAVYKLNDENLLLVTTDFFTPIVDDAFIFGKTAAANAINDIYAMGGKPLTAIAIMGWPVEKLSGELAAKVIEGANETCKIAGVLISGGHTIESPEPFFGLSVNGLAKPNEVKYNSTAKPNDIIYLTKPLGAGILATALKRGLLSDIQTSALYDFLTPLNLLGAHLGNCKAVSALTDVSGFGIMGHLTEMCLGAKLSAKIEYGKIPVLPDAIKFLNNPVIPDATYRNWNAYCGNIYLAQEINALEAFAVLSDPQTNGGFLIAVDPVQEVEFINIVATHKAEVFKIGNFIMQEEKLIRFV
jgi:selenide,water dikinase